MVPVIYNLRSLKVRKTMTVATLVGIGLVVFVLAAALMLSAGITKTMGSAGDPSNILVIRKGSDNEMSSTINENLIGLIKAKPGVVKDAQGTPLGVGEVLMVLALDKVGAPDGQISNVTLRGVQENVMKFRPSIRVVDGRPLQPGTDEVMIGKSIRGRFKGLDLGQSFDLKKNRPVKVVGIFDDGGSAHSSEIWADLETVRSAFGRQGVVSSVSARLESPSKFEAVEASIEGDKALGLEVYREDTYFEKQSEGTSMFITILGAVIAIFFSAGAMIGAMITMYGSIAGRSREIGTLRALGFSRFSILLSFLLESVILAVGGGILGAAAASCMSFVKFSMMNFQTWSEIVFTFTPTPGILLTSIIFGGAMGFLGGFFPAIKASKISPVEAMRA